MSGDGHPRSDGEETEAPESGILGNLPRTRPAVRSPRRAATAGPEAQPESGPASEETADPEGTANEAPTTNSGERPPANEIEQLAKAGLTLAGGVASIGLKVAGRAASTLRETIERR